MKFTTQDGKVVIWNKATGFQKIVFGADAVEMAKYDEWVLSLEDVEKKPEPKKTAPKKTVTKKEK